jgi:hypothetical protein
MTTHRLKGGYDTEDPRLGRVPPADEHIRKYPLTALPETLWPTHQPVFIGVNWYQAFYANRLIQRKNARGRLEWWVREGDLGRVVGGHAIVLEPVAGPHRDTTAWWEWHNQVSEGICVSEAAVRGMALLNRRRYQPRPLYDHAQTIDYWPGENYAGTSMDAGLATLRTRGAIPALRGERHEIRKGVIRRPFQMPEGISANRWALHIDEVMQVLGDPAAESATWLNSWGNVSYPQRVRVPRSVLERLHQEDGELGMVTDR